jgi:hypothetical protein
MKKLLLLSLTLFVGFFSISIMGQNKCTVGNTTISSSDNIKVFQTDDNVISTITNPRNNVADFKGRETYALNIEPTFHSWVIAVINEEVGFEYVEQVESCNIEVPEGHYSIAVGGHGEGAYLMLTYELDIHEDTTISPDESEAVVEVQIDSYDENGNILSVATPGVMNPEFIYSYQWYGPWRFGTHTINLANTEVHYKYNTLPEGTFLRPYALYYTTEGQKSYFVDYDPITEEDHGHSANRVEDMLCMRCYFNMREPDPGDTSRFTMNYTEEGGDEGRITHTHGWDRQSLFDSSEPLVVVTNIKDDHPGEFDPYEWKFRIMPMVYESTENYSDEFHDDYTFSSIFVNGDNLFVREPFDEILNNPYSAVYHESAPNHYPMTPALMFERPGENRYYGYRTPIWYFQGLAFGSDGPTGFPFYGGVFCAFGEGGLQRATDDDNKVLVQLDGETIYDDAIGSFNAEWQFMAPADGVITMDIEDNHVENQGLVMANRTHIEYDLRHEEAFPPTLTILQVMDENDVEKIDIQNLSNSKINIAGADFTIDVYGDMKMLYFDKPEIEVWYSIDGANYEPLEVYEDESMFHVNYGNFFVVDLGQLEGIANDKWVSLKVTVTDAQGNYQTQELDNLFYAGQFTSINEDMVTGKNHTVHPNPFTNEVRITTANAVNGTANIQVYNVLGAQVYQQTVNCTDTNEFTIKGSALKPGIYFYSISTENGLMQGRIVKE